MNRNLQRIVRKFVKKDAPLMEMATEESQSNLQRLVNEEEHCLSFGRD